MVFQNRVTFITAHVACYTAPLKNTVSALLEYLDLDCSIRVSRVRGALSKRKTPWNSLNPTGSAPDVDIHTTAVRDFADIIIM